MRELKFRAWEKSSKTMVYDVQEAGRKWIIGESACESFQEVLDSWEYEVMQFTGLYDKNMKQIYEGDIVRWKHKDATEHEYIISVVKWFGDEGYPAFDLEPNDGADCNALSLIFQSREYEIEVVGNVFENPELWEGKK